MEQKNIYYSICKNYSGNIVLMNQYQRSTKAFMEDCYPRFLFLKSFSKNWFIFYWFFLAIIMGGNIGKHKKLKCCETLVK